METKISELFRKVVLTGLFICVSSAPQKYDVFVASHRGISQPKLSYLVRQTEKPRLVHDTEGKRGSTLTYTDVNDETVEDLNRFWYHNGDSLSSKRQTYVTKPVDQHPPPGFHYSLHRNIETGDYSHQQMSKKSRIQQVDKFKNVSGSTLRDVSFLSSSTRKTRSNKSPRILSSIFSKINGFPDIVPPSNQLQRPRDISSYWPDIANDRLQPGLSDQLYQEEDARVFRGHGHVFLPPTSTTDPSIVNTRNNENHRSVPTTTSPTFYAIVTRSTVNLQPSGNPKDFISKHKIATHPKSGNDLHQLPIHYNVLNPSTESLPDRQSQDIHPVDQSDIHPVDQQGIHPLHQSGIHPVHQSGIHPVNQPAFLDTRDLFVSYVKSSTPKPPDYILKNKALPNDIKNTDIKSTIDETFKGIRSRAKELVYLLLHQFPYNTPKTAFKKTNFRTRRKSFINNGKSYEKLLRLSKAIPLNQLSNDTNVSNGTSALDRREDENTSPAQHNTTADITMESMNDRDTLKSTTTWGVTVISQSNFVSSSQPATDLFATNNYNTRQTGAQQGSTPTNDRATSQQSKSMSTERSNVTKEMKRKPSISIARDVSSTTSGISSTQIETTNRRPLKYVSDTGKNDVTAFLSTTTTFPKLTTLMNSFRKFTESPIHSANNQNIMLRNTTSRLNEYRTKSGIYHTTTANEQPNPTLYMQDVTTNSAKDHSFTIPAKDYSFTIPAKDHSFTIPAPRNITHTSISFPIISDTSNKSVSLKSTLFPTNFVPLFKNMPQKSTSPSPILTTHFKNTSLNSTSFSSSPKRNMLYNNTSAFFPSIFTTPNTNIPHISTLLSSILTTSFSNMLQQSTPYPTKSTTFISKEPQQPTLRSTSSAKQLQISDIFENRKTKLPTHNTSLDKGQTDMKTSRLPVSFARDVDHDLNTFDTYTKASINLKYKSEELGKSQTDNSISVISEGNKKIDPRIEDLPFGNSSTAKDLKDVKKTDDDTEFVHVEASKSDIQKNEYIKSMNELNYTDSDSDKYGKEKNEHDISKLKAEFQNKKTTREVGDKPTDHTESELRLASRNRTRLTLTPGGTDIGVNKTLSINRTNQYIDNEVGTASGEKIELSGKTTISTAYQKEETDRSSNTDAKKTLTSHNHSNESRKRTASLILTVSTKRKRSKVDNKPTETHSGISNITKLTRSKVSVKLTKEREGLSDTTKSTSSNFKDKLTKQWAKISNTTKPTRSKPNEIQKRISNTIKPKRSKANVKATIETAVISNSTKRRHNKINPKQTIDTAGISSTTKPKRSKVNVKPTQEQSVIPNSTKLKRSNVNVKQTKQQAMISNSTQRRHSKVNRKPNKENTDISNFTKPTRSKVNVEQTKEGKAISNSTKRRRTKGNRKPNKKWAKISNSTKPKRSKINVKPNKERTEISNSVKPIRSNISVEPSKEDPVISNSTKSARSKNNVEPTKKGTVFPNSTKKGRTKGNGKPNKERTEISNSVNPTRSKINDEPIKGGTVISNSTKSTRSNISVEPSKEEPVISNSTKSARSKINVEPIKNGTVNSNSIKRRRTKGNGKPNKERTEISNSVIPTRSKINDEPTKERKEISNSSKTRRTKSNPKPNKERTEISNSAKPTRSKINVEPSKEETIISNSSKRRRTKSNPKPNKERTEISNSTKPTRSNINVEPSKEETIISNSSKRRRTKGNREPNKERTEISNSVKPTRSKINDKPTKERKEISNSSKTRRTKSNPKPNKERTEISNSTKPTRSKINVEPPKEETIISHSSKRRRTKSNPKPNKERTEISNSVKPTRSKINVEPSKEETEISNSTKPTLSEGNDEPTKEKTVISNSSESARSKINVKPTKKGTVNSNSSTRRRTKGNREPNKERTENSNSVKPTRSKINVEPSKERENISNSSKTRRTKSNPKPNKERTELSNSVKPTRSKVNVEPTKEGKAILNSTKRRRIKGNRKPNKKWAKISNSTKPTRSKINVEPTKEETVISNSTKPTLSEVNDEPIKGGTVISNSVKPTRSKFNVEPTKKGTVISNSFKQRRTNSNPKPNKERSEISNSTKSTRSKVNDEPTKEGTVISNSTKRKRSRVNRKTTTKPTGISNPIKVVYSKVNATPTKGWPMLSNTTKSKVNITPTQERAEDLKSFKPTSSKVNHKSTKERAMILNTIKHTRLKLNSTSNTKRDEISNITKSAHSKTNVKSTKAWARNSNTTQRNLSKAIGKPTKEQTMILHTIKTIYSKGNGKSIMDWTDPGPGLTDKSKHPPLEKQNINFPSTSKKKDRMENKRGIVHDVSIKSSRTTIPMLDSRDTETRTSNTSLSQSNKQKELTGTQRFVLSDRILKDEAMYLENNDPLVAPRSQEEIDITNKSAAREKVKTIELFSTAFPITLPSPIPLQTSPSDFISKLTNSLSNQSEHMLSNVISTSKPPLSLMSVAESFLDTIPSAQGPFSQSITSVVDGGIIDSVSNKNAIQSTTNTLTRPAASMREEAIPVRRDGLHHLSLNKSIYDLTTHKEAESMKKNMKDLSSQKYSTINNTNLGSPMPPPPVIPTSTVTTSTEKIIRFIGKASDLVKKLNSKKKHKFLDLLSHTSMDHLNGNTLEPYILPNDPGTQHKLSTNKAKSAADIFLRSKKKSDSTNKVEKEFGKLNKDLGKGQGISEGYRSLVDGEENRSIKTSAFDSDTSNLHKEDALSAFNSRPYLPGLKSKSDRPFVEWLARRNNFLQSTALPPKIPMIPHNSQNMKTEISSKNSIPNILRSNLNTERYVSPLPPLVKPSYSGSCNSSLGKEEVMSLAVNVLRLLVSNLKLQQALKRTHENTASTRLQNQKYLLIPLPVANRQTNRTDVHANKSRFLSTSSIQNQIEAFLRNNPIQVNMARAPLVKRRPARKVPFSNKGQKVPLGDGRKLKTNIITSDNGNKPVHKKILKTLSTNDVQSNEKTVLRLLNRENKIGRVSSKQNTRIKFHP